MHRNFKVRLPIRLDFFSEDAAAGSEENAAGDTSQADSAASGEAAAAEQPPADTPQQDTKPPISADDVQRLISEALGEAAKKQTEAEKYAKMSNEEKEAHDRKTKEEEFEKRLAEVTRKELRIEAHKTLTEKGLPVELLDVLQYSDADSCAASIASVQKAFTSAVEKGVNERLRGKPPTTSQSPATLTIDSIKNMSQAEIMANYAEVEKVLAAQQ